MARDDDRGPSREPGIGARRGDPGGARTPPARPDERGKGDERARRIAAGDEERTTTAGERSRGTAAEAPEEIGRGGEDGGTDERA